MSEHAAFLRAIIDDPDEDAHRRLDRFYEDEDPFKAGVPASQLRQEHWQAWVRPLLGLSHEDWQAWAVGDSYESPFAMTFRRGFIEIIVVPPGAGMRVFLRCAHAIFSGTPLLHLHLQPDYHQAARAGALELLSLPEVGRLRTLDLSFFRLGDAGAEALLTSPNLTPQTRIDFMGNELTDAARQALKARLGGSICCDPNSEADIPF